MNNSNTKEKVHDILQSFSTAMLVTTGTGRRQESRPMHIACIDDDGTIWFLTSKGGTLDREVRDEAAVLLVCQDGDSAQLSLRGDATVVDDKAKIQQIWKEPYKTWFPKGPADPGIALVAVKPIEAEYWDNRGTNRLQYLFEAAKAYVKGEKPQIHDADQHAKTTL